jgi:hypothetical protein
MNMDANNLYINEGDMLPDLYRFSTSNHLKKKRKKKTKKKIK